MPPFLRGKGQIAWPSGSPCYWAVAIRHRFCAQNINQEWSPWDGRHPKILHPQLVGAGPRVCHPLMKFQEPLPAIKKTAVVLCSPISPDSHHSGHPLSHSLCCIPLPCHSYCSRARDGISGTLFAEHDDHSISSLATTFREGRRSRIAAEKPKRALVPWQGCMCSWYGGRD